MAATGPLLCLLGSHFQALCGSARRTGVLRARRQIFQDGPRRRALGAAFTTWWEARVAAAWTREHSTAWASVAHWRSHVLGGRAEKQLRRTQAQQAFTAWRVDLGQRLEAHQQAGEGAGAQAQVALCWTLWGPESHLRQLSQARPAQKLSARWVLVARGKPLTVLPAWALSLSGAGVVGSWWLVPGLRTLRVIGRGGPGHCS